MMEFDEFSMIFVKSGLIMEGLNHMVTAPRGLDFSVLLDCHYMLLNITCGLQELIRIIFGSTIFVGLS